MKYSIILPVHNGGEYVKYCVNSILSQSVSDFNFHILDNCSDDGTLEWINSLKDSRIIVYASQKPLTIEENWGRIVAIPKNQFMTLIGHDDLLEPDYLQIITELIKKFPDASLYQTHFKYIDNKGQIIRNCKPMDEVQSASEFLYSFLTNSIDSMGTGYMMRSLDYDALGGIPKYPNLLFADFELWIKLTKKNFKATSSEIGYSFRLHQSMTKNSSDIKFHKAFGQFIDYLESLKKSDKKMADVVEKHSVEFIKFYCRGLSHRLLRTDIKRREGLTVGSFLKECKSYADRLAPGNDFEPTQERSVKLAKQIDSNFLTRSAFLFFKKIYPKPIYS